MTRLYRSTTDKKLAGICGGIGEILDVDPTIIRLITVFLAFATGIFPLIIVYLIAWAIIPEGRSDASHVKDGSGGNG
jgi:phage shock protein C